MMIRSPLRTWTLAFLGLLPMLAGCSQPSAVAKEQTTPVIDGKVTRGVITATRTASLGSDQAGLNGVLASIHAPSPSSGSVNATEFVIQRSDDTTVSMVTHDSFSIGERVVIVDGAQAQLIPSN